MVTNGAYTIDKLNTLILDTSPLIHQILSLKVEITMGYTTFAVQKRKVFVTNSGWKRMEMSKQHNLPMKIMPMSERP